LQGYKSKAAYIVTQMPLPHTVIDFWRMVYEHNCGSIVMLNEEEGAEDDVSVDESCKN
jgi:protein tyrosine phosphatase